MLKNDVEIFLSLGSRNPLRRYVFSVTLVSLARCLIAIRIILENLVPYLFIPVIDLKQVDCCYKWQVAQKSLIYLLLSQYLKAYFLIKRVDNFFGDDWFDLKI